jgi:hypothetical protein
MKCTIKLLNDTTSLTNTHPAIDQVDFHTISTCIQTNSFSFPSFRIWVVFIFYPPLLIGNLFINYTLNIGA